MDWIGFYSVSLRNHPLAKHSDILTCIETRISMLSMTYTKYIEVNLCCFIPGKVCIHAQAACYRTERFYFDFCFQGNRWSFTRASYNHKPITIVQQSGWKCSEWLSTGIVLVWSSIANAWSVAGIAGYFIHGHRSLWRENRSDFEKSIRWIANQIVFKLCTALQCYTST